ncbi:MAG TPA: hypothetical protein VM802_07425 [Chitinophaga sp.]|uniref:hypothetical protein n=1 Tax=Chitinophaga sp. TaxID=1869181 RepID=UPI002CC38C72|nr:hypothetical protein [Chitinophaga sp.]HVI44682.1 hypothetical protein [Chitinophaga sp.]
MNGKIFRDSVSLVVLDSLNKGRVRDSELQIVTNNKTVRDSLFVGLKNKSDSVGQRDFIQLYDKSGNPLAAGADSAVFKRFNIGVNGKIFRDSVSLVVLDSLNKGRVRDSVLQIVTNNKTVRDSLFIGLKNKADSVGQRDFIQLYDKSGKALAAGADSAVFKRFNIGVNGKIFRDSVSLVVLDSLNKGRVRDSVLSMVTKNQVIRDSLFIGLKNKADSVGQRDFIQLYDKSGKALAAGADSAVFKRFNIGVNGKIFRDSVSLVVLDSLNKGRVRDSVLSMVTKNQVIRDSLFIGLKNKADSVGQRGFIQLYDKAGNPLSKGADSAVFKRFNIGVNSRAFRDSTKQVFIDSLSSQAVRDTLAKTLVTKPVKDTILSIIQSNPVVTNVKVITDQNYTVAANDYIIIERGMTATRTITLPAASASKNRMLIINQLTPSQTLSFNTSVIYSDTVTSSSLLSSFGGGATGGALKVTLVSDGTSWYVISYSF